MKTLLRFFLTNFPLSLIAGPLQVPNEFVAGTPARAAEVNENFVSTAVAVNDNNARIEAAETSLSQTINDLLNVQSNVSNIQSTVSELQTAVNTLQSYHPSGLTRIENINWEHYAQISVTDFIDSGLVVWFSNRVITESLVPPNFNYHVQLFKYGTDWDLVFDIDINQVTDVSVDANGLIADFTLRPDPMETTVHGFQLLRINATDPADISGVYRVVVRGDFIIDETNRAVDGNFVRAETPTGDFIEGGTFESIIRVIL
ncbi:MAG: hypothetical protein HWE27_11850 [Gammaproteobacteria bacterium]|nr:hypothetical protein [Gammaproteobacteria bacterium]